MRALLDDLAVVKHDDVVRVLDGGKPVRHDKGWFTAYAHTDKMYVKKGQIVKAGQKIATVGKTGGVKTPQLHFEVRYKTKPVNPVSYLK